MAAIWQLDSCVRNQCKMCENLVGVTSAIEHTEFLEPLFLYAYKMGSFVRLGHI